MHMYMYKTSVSWSVWEGDYLGVSTFLTSYIKCTQGWIFYLFGFFFRTTPCGALDIWTCKITTSFTNMQVTKHSGFQKAPSCSAPPPAGHRHPIPPHWSQRVQSSPQSTQNHLDLMGGHTEASPAIPATHHTSPAAPCKRYSCLNFQG